jgi:hypothetical protein
MSRNQQDVRSVICWTIAIVVVFWLVVSLGKPSSDDYAERNCVPGGVTKYGMNAC